MPGSLITTLLALTLLLSPAVQKPVPVGEEPRHRVVFENKYVRVIDAAVAPGDTTLFHTHSVDNVPVAISGGRLRTEVQGRQPTDSEVTTGGVGFAKASYTHRISNTGTTALRFIDAEILASPGSPANAPPLNKVPGHILVLENTSVRVYRVTLDPGQSTGRHTHALSWLGVTISAGKVVIRSPEQNQEKVEVKPGDFRWHTGAETHSLENAGGSRYEAVEIEWK